MAYVIDIACHPRFKQHAEVSLSTTQLAKQWGISTKTVSRYRSQGLPFVRDATGRCRYLPSEVASWMEQRQRGGAA